MQMVQPATCVVSGGVRLWQLLFLRYSDCLGYLLKVLVKQVYDRHDFLEMTGHVGCPLPVSS